VVSNGFTSSSTGTFTFTIADQSGTAIDVTNSFEYDDAGRLRSARTTTGLQHRYTYDEEGNLTAVEHTATATGNSAIPDWWENYYFGRVGIDPLGSAAHDGVSNLMKYALGASPLVPLSSPAGSISFASYTDGKTYPYITYVCAQEAASMLVVEQSSDAVTWQSGSACFEQVSAQDLGDGTERVVWRCLTPLPSASTLTFRLNANGQSTIAIPTGSVAMESMGPKGCDPGWPGRAVAVIKESNASIEPCNFNDATPIAASLQCLYASEGLGTRNCLARFAPPKLVLLGDSLQPSTRCRIPRLIGCSSPSFGRC
jgi:YD repeat-containing protein